MKKKKKNIFYIFFLYKPIYYIIFFITFITYILKVQLAIRFNGYKMPKKSITYYN